MANWCALADILNTTFSLITSVSNNLCSWKFSGVCFLKFKTDIEIALKPTGYTYLPKFTIQSISAKEKDVAL